MKICTFFGHRDCPDIISKALYATVSDLIANHNVTCFMVGDSGNFDRLVLNALKKLHDIYPHIRYNVILAYFPHYGSTTDEHTLYPEGFERVPAKFAISHRNEYMLNKADFVVVYVRHPAGGAANFARRAAARRKTVINLALPPYCTVSHETI